MIRESTIDKLKVYIWKYMLGFEPNSVISPVSSLGVGEGKGNSVCVCVCVCVCVLDSGEEERKCILSCFTCCN